MTRMNHFIIISLHPGNGRNAKYKHAVGLKNAIEFSKRLRVVCNASMIEHIHTRNHIKRPIRKRKLLDTPVGCRKCSFLGVLYGLRAYVYAHHCTKTSQLHTK